MNRVLAAAVLLASSAVLASAETNRYSSEKGFAVWGVSFSRVEMEFQRGAVSPAAVKVDPAYWNVDEDEHCLASATFPDLGKMRVSLYKDGEAAPAAQSDWVPVTLDFDYEGIKNDPKCAAGKTPVYNIQDNAENAGVDFFLRNALFPLKVQAGGAQRTFTLWADDGSYAIHSYDKTRASDLISLTPVQGRYALSNFSFDDFRRPLELKVLIGQGPKQVVQEIVELPLKK